MHELLLTLYNTSMLVAKNGNELSEQDKTIITDIVDVLSHAIKG